MGLKSKPPLNMYHVAVDLIESRPADDPLHRFAAVALTRMISASEKAMLTHVQKHGRGLTKLGASKPIIDRLVTMRFLQCDAESNYSLTPIGRAIVDAFRVNLEGHAQWYLEECR